MMRNYNNFSKTTILVRNKCIPSGSVFAAAKSPRNHTPPNPTPYSTPLVFLGGILKNFEFDSLVNSNNH